MTTGRPLSRPLLRWHGGKWRLAPWIIGHFPPHRVYVEPYGGAASVLLQKPRSHGEVWNDLDAGVHNLMKVLREGHAAELAQQLSLTPFSRREFELSYLPADDPVEAARRMVVRCFMGFGSSASNPKRRTGFRSNSMRSGTIPAVEWTNYPFALLDLAERLMGVVIESRPAIEVMAQHDSLDTLHYLDPPYMFETRTDRARGLCPRDERRAACRTARVCFRPEGHGDDLRLPLPALRGEARILGLPQAPAPRRSGGGAHRMPLDQRQCVRQIGRGTAVQRGE
jgi:site-specific DNA-adenine methylase